jgi:hypothetical protein
MIIRDLEHYEIGSQVNQIEQVEGGFASTALSIDAVALGLNVASVGVIDVITTSGPVSVSGFSFDYAAVAEG